jgi:hypothetical protein
MAGIVRRRLIRPTSPTAELGSSRPRPVARQEGCPAALKPEEMSVETRTSARSGKEDGDSTRALRMNILAGLITSAGHHALRAVQAVD